MAVTRVYEHPTIGSTAGAIPAAQRVADQVTFTLCDVDSSDLAIIVTHNMNLSAAELARGLPITIIQPVIASARGSAWMVGSAALPGTTGKATDTIQMTRLVAAAAGATGAGVVQIRVHLIRPHTIGR